MWCDIKRNIEFWIFYIKFSNSKSNWILFLSLSVWLSLSMDKYNTKMEINFARVNILFALVWPHSVVIDVPFLPKLRGQSNLLACRGKVFTECLRLMPIAEFIRRLDRVKQTAVRNTYILLTAEVQMFHSTSPYLLGTIPLN